MCDAHFGRKWEFTTLLLQYRKREHYSMLNTASSFYISRIERYKHFSSYTKIIQQSLVLNNCTLQKNPAIHFGIKRGTELFANTVANWHAEQKQI